MTEHEQDGLRVTMTKLETRLVIDIEPAAMRFAIGNPLEAQRIRNAIVATAERFAVRLFDFND